MTELQQQLFISVCDAFCHLSVISAQYNHILSLKWYTCELGGKFLEILF